jgi:hypothetical protein
MRLAAAGAGRSEVAYRPPPATSIVNETHRYGLALNAGQMFAIANYLLGFLQH